MIPIIIPFYQKQDQLDRCLAHLKAQSLPVEVFIHDNSQENIYFTKALNTGLRHFLQADCDYFILLNQDMYLEPDAVEVMVRFMDAHPRCGIGGPLEHLVHQPADHVLGGGRKAFPCGVHRIGTRNGLSHDEQIHWANGALYDSTQKYGSRDRLAGRKHAADRQ